MRYPIGFSTLGCPKWPWPKVLEQAAAMGYSSLEIRGIEGDMDLPKRPEFAARRLTDVRKDLAARDLVITDLGASARLHERDPHVREQQLDEARRFIDLAHNLGVPWIRVFPNEYLKDEPHEVTLARIGDTLAELGWFAKGSGVGVLVESHGDITESKGLSAIMQRDWKSLGPKLAGKLHLYVGEADTFYLDRAVHLLKDFLETTTDPYYHGTFEFGVRKPHCYAGEFDSSVGLNQHYWPEMVKHMEQTAPADADLKSWKY